MKFSDVFWQISFFPLSVQLLLAYEWMQGGFSKLWGGAFVSGMTKTLMRFEQGNPHAWYVGTFLKMAKAYPDVFAQLVQWGELFAGIGLIVGGVLALLHRGSSLGKWAMILSVAALLGGAFMNANFYFAAGWTSPSTNGFNGLMFWLQILLVLFWLTKSISPKRDA